MQLGLCIDLNRVRILQSGRIISFLFVHGLSIFCPVTRSGFERGKNTNPFINPIINPISPFAPITRPDLTRSKQGWPDFFFSAPRVGLIIIYRCTIPSVICTKALFYTSNQIDPREFTKELSRIAIRDHPSYPNQVYSEVRRSVVVDFSHGHESCDRKSGSIHSTWLQNQSLQRSHEAIMLKCWSEVIPRKQPD